MLRNEAMRTHVFLEVMDADDHYPQHLVEQCRDILLQLCFAIETEQPKEVRHLYPITHYFTIKINDLQEDFDRAGSELETVAREDLAAEFAFIANAYGFDADVEELIAPREW